MNRNYRLALLAVGMAASCSSGKTRTVAGTVTGVGRVLQVELNCAAASPPYPYVYTDASGRYSFPDAPTSACRVKPVRSSCKFDPPSVEVPAGTDSWLNVDFAGRLQLDVYGTDIGAGAANVAVMNAGAVVEDAVVHVDGTLIPFNQVNGCYSGYLDRVLAVGDAVSLDVTVGAAIVTGSGTIPEAPVLQSPTEGTHVRAADDLVVTWTSATSPEYFRVSVQWPNEQGGHTARAYDVDAAARTVTIPASDLPSGDVFVGVFAYDDGQLSGDYEPSDLYPGMNVRGESLEVLVVRDR